MKFVCNFSVGQCVPSHTSKLVKLNEPMSQSLYLTTLNDNVEGPMSVYKYVGRHVDRYVWRLILFSLYVVKGGKWAHKGCGELSNPSRPILVVIVS